MLEHNHLDDYEDKWLRLLQEKPEAAEPEPFPHNFTLCSNSEMDFAESRIEVKRAVFWFTIPMLMLNISFFVFLLGYSFFRFRKLKNSNWLTKV